MSNTDLCNLLSQRRARLQLIGPPIRYNPVSPYPAYTPNQLDMRRKAEILQYNKSSTKGNKLTKAQKFTGIMNNNKNITAQPSCIYGPDNLYKPTPTTSSDVPGPRIMLEYNPNIPLYNYATGADNYSDLINTISTKLEAFSDRDILNLSGVNTLTANLVIENIDEYLSTLTLSTPIGIYVSGTPSVTPINDASGNISINSITLSVYYNDIAISIPTPTITLDNVAFTNQSVHFAATQSTFSGTIYIGNLKISNIVLPTQPGYVYVMKLIFNLTGANNSIYTTYSKGVYANISPSNTVAINCTRTTNIVPLPRQDFSII